jgi:hypothetical protein
MRDFRRRRGASTYDPTAALRPVRDPLAETLARHGIPVDGTAPDSGLYGIPGGPK